MEYANGVSRGRQTGGRTVYLSQQDNEPVALVTKFAGAEMRRR